MRSVHSLGGLDLSFNKNNGIPEEWEITTLEEILLPKRKISYGIVQPGSHDMEGVPIVRVNNLKDGIIDTSDVMKVSPKIDEKYSRTRLKGGEVLVSLVGSLGRCAVVPSHIAGWNIARAVAVIPVDSSIGGEWVKYWISSSSSQHFISIRANTTVQATLNLSDICKLPIALPKKMERDNIVSILKSIDDKIELNNAINKNLEEIAQALFKRWFVDFEFPNENGEPYKSSGGEFEESQLGLIPKGWRIGMLGEICDSNSDTLSSKDKWNYINYLDTGSITRNYINDIQKLISGLDKIPSRARRKIKPNDIVYSTVRPNQYHYGIVKEPHENMIASTGFVVLTSKGNISNDLVYLWLTQDEVTEKLQSIAESSTSTYPSIKPSDILSFKIVIPLAEQHTKLADIIEVHHNQIWENQQQNQRLTLIRDTLLPKLISGEIRVPVQQEYTQDFDLPMVAENCEKYSSH